MPSSSAKKKNSEKTKKKNFKSKKKLNSVLIQNRQILVIFEYLQAKLQRFRDCRMLLRTRKAIEKTLADVQIKDHFFAYAVLRSCKKCLLKLTENSDLNIFTNMVAKINIVRCSQNLKID